ncbi:glycerophosphodiester phosphodiesterase family protein [Aurantibacter crassamenti]|uniref:glycerophosphodiester phosphodiesterase family protein n=1 Tax=Aurantibacter crassamenti TaxID=1837375 RepID=UPI00193AB298|nr:glycerophosphodiester phosphodiesterase family protein [Aurantibacter crassamenti]MBM1105107.1 glycerophosphodiester phosphodiesterase family protein [Aurantibacter crassamenti]
MRNFKYLVLFVGVFFMSCASVKNTTDLPEVLRLFHDSNANTVLVAAHRGAHNGNFENSIASTKKAIQLGVDIVEADVKTTKDGYLILMHDSSIDRTTTGKGKVEELTFAEIRTYNLKTPNGKISKETIPTFEEFLNVTKGRIMVDIDMKTDNVEGILAVLRKTGTTNEAFYFDNDYEQLDRILELDKTAKLMPRAYNYQMADSAITRYAPPAVHIDSKFYTQELTEMLKKNNARIWINTLGDSDSLMRAGKGEKVLEDVLKYGANMIQTDEPELILQLLRSKNLHH